jgi:alkylhydroperoxidase/carboxymuconolactone decarboxylase family protein YurZ
MKKSETAELIRATEAARGYINAGHRHLAEVDPEFLSLYNAFLGEALLHPGSERERRGQFAFPAKYRELVVSAILAFRGQPTESIANHLGRAMKLGASEKEVVEAFQAAMIAGGAPTLLNGMKALAALQSANKGSS